MRRRRQKSGIALVISSRHDARITPFTAVRHAARRRDFFTPPRYVAAAAPDAQRRPRYRAAYEVEAGAMAAMSREVLDGAGARFHAIS